MGAFERVYMNRNRVSDEQAAKIIHAYDTGSDFKKSVSLRIESSCFYIDDHRQKTPESICDARHNDPLPA